MVAQCFDLAPRGLRLVEDVLRCIGLSCEYAGEEDLSTITYANSIAHMKESERAAKSHGLKLLFEKHKLASEVLEFFIHCASREESHEPCMTILTVAKAISQLFIVLKGGKGDPGRVAGKGPLR